MDKERNKRKPPRQNNQEVNEMRKAEVEADKKKQDEIERGKVLHDLRRDQGEPTEARATCDCGGDRWWITDVLIRCNDCGNEYTFPPGMAVAFNEGRSKLAEALYEVAAADNIVTEEERSMIAELVNRSPAA